MMKVVSCLTAAVIALGSFTAAVAQPTGTTTTQPPNMSGNLPQDSLAKERGGALGESPEEVTQKGASADRPRTVTPPTATLPDGSLAEKRREAIGTPPEPVVQGGGGDAAKKQ